MQLKALGQPCMEILPSSKNFTQKLCQRAGIKVDCQVMDTSVIITFQDYQPGFEAALLVNNLQDYSITFSQRNCEYIDVPPGHNLVYAWQNPLGKKILKWTCAEVKKEHDLMKDGFDEFMLKENPPQKGYWVSFLNNMQRVLMFTEDVALVAIAQQAGELEQTNQEITVLLEGIGVSLVNNDIKSEIMYMGVTGTGIIWEGSKYKDKHYKLLNLKEIETIETGFEQYHKEIKEGKAPQEIVLFDNEIEVNFNEMVMTKPQKRYLRRTHQKGLWFQYKASPHQLQLHAKINRLQIDNQLADCVFPVVLAPVAPPKSVAAVQAPRSFIEFSVILRIAEHSTVPQFKYCKILIQEFAIKLDQAFINSMLLFFTADETPKMDYKKWLAADKKLFKSSLETIVADYSSNEQLNYFDILHLSPLKVHISFSMTGDSQYTKKATVHSYFFDLLLQSVGITFTELDDVIFRLNYFERRNVFLSQNKLMQDVISHYTSQALKQMYVLVLGLDVIGNPARLLLGIGEGVTDLFYEPFQGAIQGPEEFAMGLAIGVKSLFGHAIGGAAGAVSRITGTLGKGLAALTLDKEYQKKRRQTISHRHQSISYGIAESGKGLVMGVVNGVTGVVTKPYKGAQKSGVEGFFKGVGKGLIGVVTRPTSGAVDFTTGMFVAAKRVFHFSDGVKRLRIPRFIKPDGIVRTYSRREAEGNKILMELEQGAYASFDVYEAHVSDSEDKNVLLVTDNNIIFIEKVAVFGSWSVQWSYPYEKIKDVPKVTDTGFKFMLESPEKKGIFGQSSAGKKVHIADPENSQWIVDQITEVMKRKRKSNFDTSC